MSGLAFAALLQVANTTVSGWGRKQRRDRQLQREPIWAWHLVRAWSRYPHLLAEAIAEAHAADVDGGGLQAIEDAIKASREDDAPL